MQSYHVKHSTQPACSTAAHIHALKQKSTNSHNVCQLWLQLGRSRLVAVMTNSRRQGICGRRPPLITHEWKWSCSRRLQQARRSSTCWLTVTPLNSRRLTCSACTKRLAGQPHALMRLQSRLQLRARLRQERGRTGRERPDVRDRERQGRREAPEVLRPCCADLPQLPLLGRWLDGCHAALIHVQAPPRLLQPEQVVLSC